MTTLPQKVVVELSVDSLWTGGCSITRRVILEDSSLSDLLEIEQAIDDLKNSVIAMLEAK